MTVYASLSQGPANDSPDSSPDKGDPKYKTNSPWKKKIKGGKGKAKAGGLGACRGCKGGGALDAQQEGVFAYSNPSLF